MIADQEPRRHGDRERHAELQRQRQLEAAAGETADGYHAYPTHSTYFEYIRNRDKATSDSINSKGWVHNLGNGHAVRVDPPAPWGRPCALGAGLGQEVKDEVEALNTEIMSGSARSAATRRQRRPQPADLPEPGGQRHHGDHGAHLLSGPARQHRGQRLGIAPATNRETCASGASQLPRVPRPGGFATPDDLETLESASAATPTCASRMERPLARHAEHAPTKTDELQMRTFWRRWHGIGNAALELAGPRTG